MMSSVALSGTVFSPNNPTTLEPIGENLCQCLFSLPQARSLNFTTFVNGFEWIDVAILWLSCYTSFYAITMPSNSC